jgi:hypothetical protein
MALLLAEELLLVAYQPDGTARGQATELDCGLGGAVLVELVLGGHAEIVSGRLSARPGHPPVHPVLADAYGQVAAKSRKPRAWVTRFAKGTRRRLLSDLVATEVLRDESYKSLGLFTRHRFPVTNPRVRDEILDRLRAVVLDGAAPDPRTAGLAGMVWAAKLERRVFPDADRRTVQERLRRINDDQWAAEAVRRAIDAVRAATVAAVLAASTAATAGGSS